MHEKNLLENFTINSAPKNNNTNQFSFFADKELTPALTNVESANNVISEDTGFASYDGNLINESTYDAWHKSLSDSEDEPAPPPKKPKAFGAHAAQFQKIHPKEYYRFVIDGKLQAKDQEESFARYSLRQHGAVAALLNAMAYAITPATEEGLSLEIIKEIHRIASKPPKYPYFCSCNFRKNPTGFEFHQMDSNLTEQGFKTLAAHHKDDRTIKIFPRTAPIYIANLLETPCESLPEDIDAAWEKLKIAMENDKLIFYFAPSASSISTSLQSVCEAYHAEIQQEGLSDEDKIRIIVKAIQQIEQIHPFEDGNCRTCYVILQKLLLENNLLPAILQDPNHFDGYGVDELVKEVMEGIERTNLLLNNPDEKIYGYNSPTKETYLLRSHQFKAEAPEWHYTVTFDAAENLGSVIQQMPLECQMAEATEDFLSSETRTLQK